MLYVPLQPRKMKRFSPYCGQHQLARLPETWKNQIEGHPILGSIPFHAERLELASIADDIMGIAGQSLQTMYNIDTLILKIWGIEKELPQKTMQDLAYRYPEVMELNEWYSYADFSVQKPTTNKSQE